MKIEIYHDILAKKILEKVSADTKMLRKVERLVNERYEFYAAQGYKKGLLNENDLDMISPYLNEVKLEDIERGFINKSRRALQGAKRSRRALSLGVIFVLTVLLGIALTQWKKANRSLDAAKAAEESADSAKIVALAAERDALIALENAGLAYEELEKEKNRANQQRIEAQRAERAANFSLARLYGERSESSVRAQNLQEAWLYNLASINQELGQQHIPMSIGRLLLPEIRPRTAYQNGIMQTSNSVYSLAINEDKKIAVFGGSGYRIDVFDLLSKTLIDSLSINMLIEENQAVFKPTNSENQPNPVNLISDIAVDPSGSFIAFCVSSNAETLIKLEHYNPHPVNEYLFVWPLNQKGERKISIKYLGTKVNCLSFNSLGTHLAVGTGDKGIFLFEKTNFQRINEGNYERLYDYEKYETVNCLSFSKNDKKIFSGHKNGAVIVTDVKTQKAKVLGKHQASVRSIKPLKNTRLLATGGADKKIIIWDYKRRRKRKEWKAHLGEVTNLSLSATGNILFSTSANALRLWDWRRENLCAHINTPSSINDITFYAAEQFLMLSTTNMEVREVNLKIDLFDEIEDSLFLEKLIMQPWEQRHKKDIKKIYANSLDVLGFNLKDSYLQPKSSLQTIKSSKAYFGGANYDISKYEFSTPNLTAYTSEKAETPSYPQIEDSTYTLTADSLNNIASALFLNTEVIPPFTVNFEYAITNEKGKYPNGEWSDWPGDGLVFLFLKDTSSYRFEVPKGGSRGFISDGKGYGIHFATFGKDAIILTDGYANELANSYSAKNKASLKPVFTDGEWRKVKVKVTDQLIVVEYDGREVIRWEGTVDLASRHLGFSAANGGATSTHQVRNVAISME